MTTHEDTTDRAGQPLRILVAGGTGVIGNRVVRRLAAAGHVVAGTTRSEARAGLVEQAGGEPIVCDVYDAAGLTAAVTAFAPDVVVHQLTDLPDSADELPARRAGNARIRVEGTRHLLDAAAAAGCRRILAQSVAWTMPPGPGADAVRYLEDAVLGVGGVVLRYGQLYGPGTFYPTTPPDHPRVHVDTAAERTVELLGAPRGVVEVVEG